MTSLVIIFALVVIGLSLSSLLCGYYLCFVLNGVRASTIDDGARRERVYVLPLRGRTTYALFNETSVEVHSLFQAVQKRVRHT